MPSDQAELPTNFRAILNRMEEICFNSALMREMRMVAFFTEAGNFGKYLMQQ
jgi:hypothetical protein